MRRLVWPCEVARRRKVRIARLGFLVALPCRKLHRSKLWENQRLGAGNDFQVADFKVKAVRLKLAEQLFVNLLR